MHLFLIILYSVLVTTHSPQSLKDPSVIQEKNYTGYIMSVEHTEAKYDPSNIYSRPSPSEAILSEKMLASYLDIFCRLNNGWRQLNLSHSDSALYRKLFTTHFNGYYRQYTSYIPKKGGHKFVSICLVSPEFKDRVSDKKNYLKINWAEIDAGGAILFHADIDLTTGDVFLRDNGSN